MDTHNSLYCALFLKATDDASSIGCETLRAYVHRLLLSQLDEIHSSPEIESIAWDIHNPYRYAPLPHNGEPKRHAVLWLQLKRNGLFIDNTRHFNETTQEADLMLMHTTLLYDNHSKRGTSFLQLQDALLDPDLLISNQDCGLCVEKFYKKVIPSDQRFLIKEFKILGKSLVAELEVEKENNTIPCFVDRYDNPISSNPLHVSIAEAANEWGKRNQEEVVDDLCVIESLFLTIQEVLNKKFKGSFLRVGTTLGEGLSVQCFPR